MPNENAEGAQGKAEDAQELSAEQLNSGRFSVRRSTMISRVS